jgi:threonine dehydrogenase-like Zn-dependent dehydrogenase
MSTTTKTTEARPLRDLKIKNIHPDQDSSLTMLAAEWHGAENIKMVERPKPIITEPKDVIIRVTSTSICGSDLHLYMNLVPTMEKGDVMGHEFMGIVDDVGPEVKDFKKGDRVVASAVIACGECEFCQKGAYSCCDTTNPSDHCEQEYGHRTAGIFGYSHMTGGYDGGQAEYVRVPLGDFNLLKVPESLSDEKVLFLSDIVCTGWQANELGNVSKGHIVAVWGCGAVGLMAQAWAKFRGAAKIIAIDNDPHRLKMARRKIGSYTINFDKADVLEALRELVPGGPDVVIEAAGFRFPKTLGHRVQTLVKLERDAMDILTEMIKAVKKNGTVAIVGDYFGTGNQFPIGAFMEKALTMRSGQVFVQKYWKELLGYIEAGEFDPTFVITHRMSLEDIPLAYKMFQKHEDNLVKVVIHVDKECDPDAHCIHSK